MPLLKTQQQNLNIQKWVAGISVILLAIKFLAYYLTHSVAVLTDALESIVNVAAGFIGLYSLYIAAKPADINHPYGHGKAEFLSAAVEGTLILSAGAIIIYKAIQHLIFPVTITSIDEGIALVGATAVINLAIGAVGVRFGKRNQSLALVASGRHLISDSYSTFGIIAGLLLILFTKLIWIDSAVAILFGVIIIYTGYKIIRRSIAGIMDEADEELLGRMIQLLNVNRRENWVDLHNLRVIKYGSVLHVDCHLTVPWYLNIQEAHAEIEALATLIRKEFGELLELFVHSDGCLYVQCPICIKTDCPVRHHPLEKRIEWTLENILMDKKHQP
ncbi:MAG TPA: cation diffusion facilitator family transporter [Chitinophagaceae bacterium]|nr:cation diffusion facilitator family transporter [Chitinophagaceae bacterium]